MGFADGGGMQGEARHLGQQGNPGRLFQRRHAVQGEGLSPGMRADLDAVGNRGRPQVVEAGTGHQVQIGVIRIGDQQESGIERAPVTSGVGDLLMVRRHDALVCSNLARMGVGNARLQFGSITRQGRILHLAANGTIQHRADYHLQSPGKLLSAELVTARLKNISFWYSFETVGKYNAWIRYIQYRDLSDMCQFMELMSLLGSV